jgi:Fanconi-associated nuclease 1
MTADQTPTGPAPGLDFARRDLAEAVTVALAREGHILTAGEVHIARGFLTLPNEAASLYARLHGRRRTIFRVDQLDYTEITDMPGAILALVASGYATDERWIPTRLLLEARTVEELKGLCREAGTRQSGRRQDLLDRLSGVSRSAATLPALMLRHRGLFARLCRLYLCDHSGDLSRLVIARMGVLRYPEYTPTGGAGLFPERRELLAYEAALYRRATLTDAELLDALPDALRGVESRQRAPGHRYRFSARRFDADVAMLAARALERARQTAAAADIYRRLIEAGIREQSHAIWRRAMCLAELGQPDEGARLCAEARESAQPDEALALERTGRRLAKKAGIGWRPMPPVPAPRVREVQLVAADLPGNRPGYETPDGPQTIEPAVCALLAGLGRRALFGESAPWSTLFGLLFYDAIFAPVPDMLPTPLMMQPLDMSTPEFAMRRRQWMDPIFSAIEAGEAPRLLAEALERLDGVSLPGVRFDRLPPEELALLTAAIDGRTLSGILRCFAQDRRNAGRGLPDLCVLPGPEVRLPRSIPARIHSGLLLAELKGPTDSIRDSQRIWLSRLRELGVTAEVWKIKRAGTAAG